MNWRTTARKHLLVAGALAAAGVAAPTFIAAGITECLHCDRQERPTCPPDACRFGYHPTTWQPWPWDESLQPPRAVYLAVPQAAAPPPPAVPVPPVVAPRPMLPTNSPPPSSEPAPPDAALLEPPSGKAVQPLAPQDLPQTVETAPAAEPVSDTAEPVGPELRATSPAAEIPPAGAPIPVEPPTVPQADVSLLRPPVLASFSYPAAPPPQAWAPPADSFREPTSYRSRFAIAPPAPAATSYRSPVPFGGREATTVPGTWTPDFRTSYRHVAVAPTESHPAPVLGPAGTNVPTRSYRSAAASPLAPALSGMNYRSASQAR